MADYPILTLKPDREVHLKNRHHAIYRTTVAQVPAGVKTGSIVEVRSSDGAFLCFATWNPNAYICGRVVAFEPGDPLAQMRKTIEQAVAMRRWLAAKEPDTTAWRLLNAEGDALPGLIVDQYGDILVVQLTTFGMERLRDWVADALMEICKPTAIFEKSTGAARKNEGLDAREGWLRGQADERVEVTERGVKYVIQLAGSQKTGLFLDQREMRSLVRAMAKDKTVLDICSYVGGFSLSAMAGGAKTADAVDYDATAVERIREHRDLNGYTADRLEAYAEDAFAFLRGTARRSYDFIVLDPPAFAKRSSDLDPAKKAYTDLNRMALQMLPPGGLLLTCSCSYQVDKQIFQTIVFHAARQAKRAVRIIGHHRQAMDHPINLYHPETDYLKSLLLYVE
jgi:23S rRNA (cytosine1962-C5)-methyltransferase